MLRVPTIQKGCRYILVTFPFMLCLLVSILDGIEKKKFGHHRIKNGRKMSVCLCRHFDGPVYIKNDVAASLATYQPFLVKSF